MKKWTAVLLASVLMMFTACTGPFKLTRAVHRAQTSFENKWVDEVAFLACVIFPVYGFSTLGDAIIFNSVEFWTGDNPMDTVELEKDGKTVKMTLQDDGSIRISDGQKVIKLVRSTNGVRAEDGHGDLMYRAVQNQGSEVSVYDDSGQLVYYPDNPFGGALVGTSGREKSK